MKSMSLMKIISNIGPKTDPCGIPIVNNNSTIITATLSLIYNGLVPVTGAIISSGHKLIKTWKNQ